MMEAGDLAGVSSFARNAKFEHKEACLSMTDKRSPPHLQQQAHRAPRTRVYTHLPVYTPT